MSSNKSSKSVELAAIVASVLAIIASAYFIFLTEANMYRITNLVIAIAFVVFVVYNFLTVRNLRSTVEGLNDDKGRLEDELAGKVKALKETTVALEESTEELEQLNSSLLAAQAELKERDEIIEKLKVK